jgi:hypothetical protein
MTSQERNSTIGVLIWAGAAVLAAATVPVYAQSNSRLAPHLIGGYTTGCQQIIQAHPRVIKILDVGGGMLAAAREYKAGTPNGKVVLRIYTPKGYNTSHDPAWAANDFWTTVLAPPINSLSPSDRALID